MKCSKYFGAKWRGFIKSESILAPKGASRFKTQNIRYDISPFLRGCLRLIIVNVHGEIMKSKGVKLYKYCKMRTHCRHKNKGKY